MSRYKWTAIEPSNVVEGPHYKRQSNIKRRGTRENAAIDKAQSEKRKAWVLLPPANIVVRVPSGLVLSVPQAVGAYILYRRRGTILERDGVAVDAVIEGEYQDAIEAFGL